MMSGLQNVNSSTTNDTFDDSKCEILFEKRASYLFRAIALCCIMLMSLIGNGLVCYAATRKPRRPFSYHLITNLAVAELVFTGIQPFDFIYYTKPYSWIFGEFMCHVIDPLILCTTLVITFTLATIAVYRCITMLQPHRYRPSARVAYRLIAVSWIWGIVLSLPDSVTREKLKYEACDVIICNSSELPKYRMTLFILNFVVPFLALGLSYGRVIFRIRKHIVKTREQSVELNSIESFVTSSSIISTDARQQAKTRDKRPNIPSQNELPVCLLISRADSQPKKPSTRMMRLEADVLNMIYLIILLFFLCYLPSNVLYILTEGLGLKSLKNGRHYWIMHCYLNLLHTLPSALHPICYGANSRVFGGFLSRYPCQRRWIKK